MGECKQDESVITAVNQTVSAEKGGSRVQQPREAIKQIRNAAKLSDTGTNSDERKSPGEAHSRADAAAPGRERDGIIARLGVAANPGLQATICDNKLQDKHGLQKTNGRL